MDKAMELYEAKRVKVIPIPISASAWLDYPVSSVLAATKDGKYISDYSNPEAAWFEVYQNIKVAVSDLEAPLRTTKDHFELSFSENFCSFLNNTEILSKTHSTKKELLLEDILVYPELTSLKYKLPEVHCNCMQAIKGFVKGDRVAIVGEEQSGKTTLAKLYIKELHSKGLIPILVKEDVSILQGNLRTKIESSFQKQYNTNSSILI